MGLEAAIQAEQAAIRAQQAARRGSRTSRYAGMKTPGIDTTKIYSDPCCMLKDADKRRASGDQYVWRKPDDPYTKSMCLRGVLKPVLAEDLDPESPYANVERVKIITRQGPREVVRTPGGLGLFLAPPGLEMNNVDQGLLPGEQWEAKYENEVADNADQFASDMEVISNSSVMGRVKGEITQQDTQREVIA